VIVKKNPEDAKRRPGARQTKKNALVLAALAMCLVCLLASFFAGGYFSKNMIASRVISPIVNKALLIPLNWTKSLFVKTDRINLEFDPDDVQYLEKCLQQQGNEGNSRKEFIAVGVRCNRVKAKARIRMVDSLPGFKIDSTQFAFGVRMKAADSILGMRSFLLLPLVPGPYMGYWFFQEILKHACSLSVPEKRVIDLSINSKSLGAYCAWEIKDDRWFIGNENDLPRTTVTMNDYFLSVNDSQAIGRAQTPVSTECNECTMLKAYMLKQAKAGNVFDIKRMARMVAVLDFCGYKYTTAFSRIRFEFDEDKRIFIAVGFDFSFPLKPRSLFYTSKLMKSAFKGKPEALSLSEYDSLYAGFFADTGFSAEYVRVLDSIVGPERYQAFIESIRPDFNVQMKKIYKTNPGFSSPDFSVLDKNQEYLLKQIHPPQAIQAYFKAWDSVSNMLTLQIGNIQALPVKILSIQKGHLRADRIGPQEAVGPKAPFDFIDFKEFQFKMPGKFDRKTNIIDSLRVLYSLYGASRIEYEPIIPWTYLDE
jgi:hypothetical protein